MASPREIDAAKIAFGPKDGKYAGTTVEGELPKYALGTADAPLRAPFGISTPFSGDETGGRRTMDLEITDPEMRAQLSAVDEAVVAAGVHNAQAWFGKPLNEAGVRAMHTPLVIAPKREQYAPTVRTKVTVAEVETFVYLGNGRVRRATESATELVGKGAQVAVRATLSSVYFANKQFGVTLHVKQLLVMPSAEASSASAFGCLLEEEPPPKRAKPTKEEEEPPMGAALAEERDAGAF